MNQQLRHSAPTLLPVAAALAALVLTVACTTPNTGGVGSTQSALVGTVDATAASDCAGTYVTCVRGGGTTCRAELTTCVSAAATSADGSAAAGGDGGGGRKGGGGNCNKDGTIDRSSLEACLDALEECAAGSATVESCVAGAVTCVTTPAPSSSSDTPAAEAGAGPAQVIR